MAHVLPKIKLGRNSDRNFFDLTHDVNTTSDFGFCQPTLIHNVVADSKFTLRTKSFVRLAPLPCPTFGRINVKFHTAFVPYRDVFLAYDSFISHNTVQSGIYSYIPEEADYIENMRLFWCMVNQSYIACQSNQRINMLRSLFKFNLFVRVETNPDAPNGLGFARDKFYDPLNSPEDMAELKLNQLRNAVTLYDSFFTDGVLSTNSPFNQTLINNGAHKYNQIGTGYSISGTGKLSWLNFINLDLWRDYEAFVDTLPSGEKATFDNFAQVIKSSSNLKSFDTRFFSEPSALENADFIFNLGENLGYTVPMYDSGGNLQNVTVNSAIITFKLTPFGRRLMKVLTADGVNFGMKDIPVDVISLLSYYKVWFDKYNPGRNSQWFDTNAYYLIHHFYDFGKTISYSVINANTVIGGNTYSNNALRQHFLDFLCDLADCCYSLPIDNVTVATQDVVNQKTDNNLDQLDINLTRNYPSANVTNPTAVSPAYGTQNSNLLDISGGLGIKLLNRIYSFVNKNSVIGKRIDEYLKAHNLGSPLPDSLVLGDRDYNIMIDEQYSTAETSEGYLGEFAGKATGGDEGETLHFETPNSGVLVQFMCIVPYGGYVQGGRPAMVNRYDFYNSLYDSLGKEPLSAYEVLSRFYLINGINYNTVFGYVPQYFNKKVKNNLANGGFALRSQMASFLPYSLDRLFSVPDLAMRVSPYNQSEHPYVTDNVSLQADEYLRFIGRSEGFGNYNRIFYDATGYTDNFICTMVQDFKMYSPMKPVSESFDTFDPEMDNGHNQVMHS